MIERPEPRHRLPDTALSPTVRIVSLRLRGARRAAAERAVRATPPQVLAASDILAEESLPRLAHQSLWLFVGSAAAYAILIGASRQWNASGPLLGDGSPLARFGVLALLNILSYLAIIPLHEAAHALAILAQGGRPRFGLKLPLAAYCTAPNQLFFRNGYLVVALAPLIALSVLALAVAALQPNLAATMLLAVAGNVSGAVGDLETTRQIARLPASSLIADTQTGFIAYRAPQV